MLFDQQNLLLHDDVWNLLTAAEVFWLLKVKFYMNVICAVFKWSETINLIYHVGCLSKLYRQGTLFSQNK